MSGPPDLGATVDDFGFPVTFKTYAAPTKDANGYLTAPAPTSTSGKAHIYPTPGKRREMLPENMRDGEIWSGGTVFPVTTAVEGGARGTEIEWGDKVLEVVQVQHYTGEDGTGGYYEFEARRVYR